MQRIATVDERFQSYNVEMVEVTGGRFWKRYKDIAALLQARDSAKRSPETGAAVPVGMAPGLYSSVPRLISPTPDYVSWLAPWAQPIYG